MQKRAIFLDRDGTLVHARHYPSQPSDLLLYDHIDAGLRMLQHAGFQLVVVTNQSGIALGYFDEAELHAMHKHLAHELEQLGVQLDGIYFCPHHPHGAIRKLAVACECRKPRPGMLLRAAADLDIDLPRSWLIGDILDDVEAGNRAGCRTILVDLATEPSVAMALRQPEFIARDTAHALAIVAAAEGLGPPVEVTYQPISWEIVTS
jgi:D-glycero-D-manno-heptose 1,7-bisphosphate phosphatase